jgi:chromosome segregation protein
LSAAAETERRNLQDELIRRRAAAGQRALLRDSLKESLAAAEKARAEAEAGLAESEAALAEAEAEAAGRRRAAAGLRREAERLIALRREAEGRLARLRDELGRAGASESSLRAEGAELSKGIKELEGLLEGFGGETESRLLAIRELEASVEALEAASTEKQAEAEEQRRRAEAARGRLAALIEEKLACEAGKTRAEKEAQEKNRLIIELERRCAEISQRKLSCEAEEKQLVDKLWDSYELSRSAARKLRLELDSAARAARRVAEIRRELASLGSPNLGAIEEYERVSERYAFLREQRDDIEKAKKELQNLVNGITAEMERLFTAEFRAIAEKFSETFTELFGGGKAELILEDEKDILNCGIEIKIQPPGKTARSLTLLSGGERAFVAIALYFAILKVRPTPFCVLDEIEAALDESNVVRFAEYMRKMSENTQFLVITHRRGTMEEAAELYGVTMQKGISRVLSVEPGKYLKDSG